MKCDEFIAHYESHSAWRRLRARLHAHRCPTCASTRDWLSEVRRQLAASAEITPFHRRVWERAATDGKSEPVSRRVAFPQLAIAGGLALAAVLVVALVLSLPKKHKVGPEDVVFDTPQRSSSPIVTRPIESSQVELAALEAGLKQLEVDLERLSDEAASLEVLRALGELAAQHRPLNAGDSI
jgi:hypothetical protein